MYNLDPNKKYFIKNIKDLNKVFLNIMLNIKLILLKI